jgi:uncharacterized protein YjiS (DUF1127 family)
MNRSLADSSHESRINVLTKTAFGFVVAKAIARCLAWIRCQRRTRRGYRQLIALDDYMLADMGLTRDQVGYAVRHGGLPEERGENHV